MACINYWLYEVPDSDWVYSKVFRVLDSDRVPDDVQTVYNSALCTRVCVWGGGGGWWGEAWRPGGLVVRTSVLGH